MSTATKTPTDPHLVMVDDVLNITACTCGLHYFGRPSASTIFAAFEAEHTALIEAA